jgi:hypothetical protein
MKVNRANAQSRHSGILCASAHGKLCFALLTSYPAAPNHLPRCLDAGGRIHSEVVYPVEDIFDMEQALCIASPLKSNRDGNRKEKTESGRAQT